MGQNAFPPSIHPESDSLPGPGFGGGRGLAVVDGEVAVPDATGLRPGQEMG